MNERINVDSPPFSRVFIVCSKLHREEDINAAFSQYGTVEDVWMVKDRMTKENKGICYIKFDKASSAALAIENLDGKVIGDEPKPIKVFWVGQSIDCSSQLAHSATCSIVVIIPNTVSCIPAKSSFSC